ncbi:MAG TPA: sugar ABC transporter permease [Anaerolineales bacterium]|jgi:glucose/mannose transport system permease protein|nr:sugar ABC transporter permease [Anaerolineales bacterium]
MRHSRKDRTLSILLVLPSVIAMFIFIYGFIGFTAYSSLSNWHKLKPDFTFVGFDNYTRLFKSQRFIIDMQNTFTFTLLFLIVTIVLGFLLAVVLDQNIKGESIFRNIFLFPMALSYIVTGVVWRWLLAPGTILTGPSGINILFDKFGLGFLKSGWYTDPDIGIKAVVIAATWQMAGYIMALYLAGMRAIPEEMREAARVDGATVTQVYRFIVIPLLRPITLSAVIILGHISLKIFDLIVSMTGPGTGFSTDVPALFMFDTTFRGNRFAQGSAIAMVLLLLVALLVVPYLVSSYREEVQR